MSRIPLLTTSGEVANLARTLIAQPVVAVDLEADSMHSYQEKVCLLQFTWQDETLLLDPLAGADLSPLKPFFADEAICKIFHAADYDVRCLARDFAIEVKGLFDTMVASQLLGEERVGLADVLKKYFAVELDKSCQRADWSQRPLPEKMLRYAADDTRYLERLMILLKQRLEEKGRMSWAAEEFSLLQQGRFQLQEGPLFLRLKGAALLPRRGLAVAEQLLHWRDREAERRDCPPYKVLDNKAILALAQNCPTDEIMLEQVAELVPKLRQRYGGALVREVARALEQSPASWPVFPRGERKARDPLAEKRLTTLKKWRAEKAEALQLEAGILINNSLLERIAYGVPRSHGALAALPGMKGWQQEVLGDEILAQLGE
ncbi:MAG: ribonuclease D [Desulfuromonadaceae bacterium]|nr:ribonuclease D [Desulfuromonadaceae bacterium]